MAPEVISKGRLYDTKADIWSFGITVLEMAHGEPPLSGQSAQRVFSAMNAGFEPPKLEAGEWSREMRDFVAACLQEDPENVRHFQQPTVPFHAKEYSSTRVETNSRRTIQAQVHQGASQDLFAPPQRTIGKSGSMERKGQSENQLGAGNGRSPDR